MIINSS